MFRLAFAILLLLPSWARAQQDAEKLELRLVKMPPVAPTEAVALTGELVNVGSVTISEIQFMGGGLNYHFGVYDSDLFDGNPSEVFPEKFSLAPGEKRRFVMAGLYPRGGKAAVGRYSFDSIAVTVRTARQPSVSLIPVQMVEIEVSENTRPLAERIASGEALLPANRRKVEPDVDLKSWLEQAKIVAVVDVQSIRDNPWGPTLDMVVLQGVQGARTGDSLSAQAPYIQGCHWRIAAGRYLVFLAERSAQLVPLGCRGSILPIRSASGGWSTGYLNWHPSSAGVIAVTRELEELRQKIVAKSPERAAPAARDSAAHAPEREMARARPAEFRGAPANVVAFLDQAGCTIPQPGASPPATPVNLVRGEFAHRGQQDWAALCSKQGISSIVVFWGGSERCESPVPQSERSDADCPKRSGVPAQGSCRRLAPLPPEGVDRSAERSRLPAVDHDAIAEPVSPEVFASYYCRDGNWTRVVNSRGNLKQLSFEDDAN